jgi:DmsE family decaheme c-type cytochrome
MNPRTSTIIGALAAICICFVSPVYAAQPKKADKTKKTTAPTEAAPATKATKSPENLESKFNLKPGAQQKVCLTCHANFEEKLKKAFVHTPLKKAGCIACHNPHTSHYPKQLEAEASSLCLTCHKEMMPAGARSTHKVVAEGKCVQCHDPHASDYKFNLLKSGNDLCYGCHKDKAEAITKVKFKHKPVETGCVTCHTPHASAKAAALLKSDPPALCQGCHQIDKPIFVKKHSNYPAGNSRCTMCHSAHGSDQPGLIHNTVHQPFAKRMCNQCHGNAGEPNSLALKKRGFELCRGCHSAVVNDMFSKNRLHAATVGKDGCLNCHSPHASPQRNLMNEPMIPLCKKCHADTIQRQEQSPTKHEPIKDGMCTVCHAPHASDNTLFFTQASTIEMCGTCHDWQKHSTHPIGEKVIDKRNKNLTMQCLSCHRSHGTEYKHMLPTATVSELCTQCHLEKSR